MVQIDTTPMPRCHSSALTCSVTSAPSTRLSERKEGAMPFRFIATVTAILVAGVAASCSSGDKPASAVASGEARPGRRAGRAGSAESGGANDRHARGPGCAQQGHRAPSHHQEEEGRRPLRSGGRGFEQRWACEGARALHRAGLVLAARLHARGLRAERSRLPAHLANHRREGARCRRTRLERGLARPHRENRNATRSSGCNLPAAAIRRTPRARRMPARMLRNRRF